MPVRINLFRTAEDSYLSQRRDGRDPAERLMVAVLERAIKDAIGKTIEKHSFSVSRVTMEARVWLGIEKWRGREKLRYTLPFEYVAECLNLDPSLLRQRVIEVIEGRKPLPWFRRQPVRNFGQSN